MHQTCFFFLLKLPIYFYQFFKVNLGKMSMTKKYEHPRCQALSALTKRAKRIAEKAEGTVPMNCSCSLSTHYYGTKLPCSVNTKYDLQDFFLLQTYITVLCYRTEMLSKNSSKLYLIQITGENDGGLWKTSVQKLGMESKYLRFWAH